MSSSNYSSILNDYVDELEMKYNDEDITSEDLLDNLSCKFRTFSSSPDSFILKYTDYPYDINNIDAKKKYLSTKYKNIGYKINLKSLKLPNSLKSNFPSRHTLNDLHLYFFEGSKPVKNDELRKTIILLFFYKFWCEQFLEINKVNPFDLLFIFSARCENPLSAFRDIYASLVDEI